MTDDQARDWARRFEELLHKAYLELLLRAVRKCGHQVTGEEWGEMQRSCQVELMRNWTADPPPLVKELPASVSLWLDAVISDELSRAAGEFWEDFWAVPTHH